MTKLLDEAVAAVRRLPSGDQNEIARAIMRLAGSDLAAPVVLSPEERDAIARFKAAARRGEFATDEQVRAVWPSTVYEASLYASRARRSYIDPGLHADHSPQRATRVHVRVRTMTD